MLRRRSRVVTVCLATGAGLGAMALLLGPGCGVDSGEGVGQSLPAFPDPARVWRAVSLGNTRVLVTFTEPMADEAGTLGFYRFSPSLRCIQASLSADARSVTLTTAPQADEEYTLLVGDCMAADGDMLDPDSRAASFFGIASFDTRAPQVIDAVATDRTTVSVAFTEPVDARAENVTSYAIVTDDAAAAALPCTAAVLSASGTEVTLTTAPQQKTEYLLTVWHVGDLTGNLIDTARNSVSFMGIGETNTAEYQPPRVTGAISTGNTKVLVSYSKLMGDTAADPANYLIGQANVVPEAGGLIVTAADFRHGDRSAVELTTLSQSQVEYMLKVVHAKDLAGNPMASRERDLDHAVASFWGTGPTTSGGGPIDTDGDGLTDDIEQRGWTVTVVRADGSYTQRDVSSDPYRRDTDGDRLQDQEELYWASDPRSEDTDVDLLNDKDEVAVYLTSPTHQDTDGDGLSDTQELTRHGTSPIRVDTDGDNFSDHDEVVSMNRDPRIADLPRPQIDVGNMALQLDTRFTFTDTLGVERSVQESTSTALEESTTQVLAFSDSTTNRAVAEIGTEVSVGLEVGGEASEKPKVSGKFSTSAKVSAGFSYMNENTTSVSRQTAQTAKRAYEESLTTAETVDQTQSVRREVIGASVDVLLTIGNVGDTAFTMTNLEVTALQQDPAERRRFLPLATLIPAVVLNTGEVPSYTSGPGIPERGPFVFSSREVFPSMVEDLMKNPRGLVFKVANFDVNDEFGRNLAFTMQSVNERTAGITIDYANGEVDRWRVAVSGALDDAGHYLGGFDPQGRQTGLPLAHILQEILDMEKNSPPDAIIVGEDGCAQTWASGDDVQVVQPVCPPVEPGGDITRAGPNGRLESVPRGDDLRLGDAVIDGGDGCAHTVAVGDDEQIVAAACEAGGPDGIVVLPGPNHRIDTTPPVDASGDPLDEIANVTGYATELVDQCDGSTLPAVIERGPLTADTWAIGDDEQIVPYGDEVEPWEVIIGPGSNGVLDTTTSGNDVVSTISGTEIVEPDRTADTLAEGDDVQEVPLGSLVATGEVIVSPGPDGVLQTPAGGNDVEVAPGYPCKHGCPYGNCRAVEMVVRIKSVRDDPATSRFWVLMTTAAFNPGMDFDAIMLNSGDNLTLAYVQDKDHDRMFAREEYLYGSSDRRVNSDGCPDPDRVYGFLCNDPSCAEFDTDCLTDFEEVKVGWEVEVEGRLSYLGFSDPVLPDADADGILDDMERVYGTDPGKSDSDDDGISDGDEVNGYAILTKDRQHVIRYLDPYETAIVTDGGDGMIDTPLAGDDAWVDAGACDAHAPTPGSSCHAHADCRDLAQPSGLCGTPIGITAGGIIITPGGNGVLESIPDGDDERGLSDLIIDGGNGETESTPAGDDVYHDGAENLLVTVVFKQFSPGGNDCDADDVLVGACDQYADNQGDLCLGGATCTGERGGVCEGVCDGNSANAGAACITSNDCDDQTGSCDIGGTDTCMADAVNVGDPCATHADCVGLVGSCTFPGSCDAPSQNAGQTCNSDVDCTATSGGCDLPGDVCVDGTNHGNACTGDIDCPGGTCVTPMTQFYGEYNFQFSLNKNATEVVFEETEDFVPVNAGESRMMERSVSFALAPHESFTVSGSIGEVDSSDSIFERGLPGNEEPVPPTWAFSEVYQAGALTVDQHIEETVSGPTLACACCYDDDQMVYTITVEGTVRPGGMVILPGPDGELDSTPGGDDLIPTPHASLFATNPLSRDTDADSLPDGLELELGANPNDFYDVGRFRDSDRDGLTDGQESDGWFVGYREPGGTTYCADVRGGFLMVADLLRPPDDCVTVTSDPLEPDTDGDGLPDSLEMILRTDPRDRDTDGDTLLDYDELDPESPHSIYYADLRDFQDLCATGERCSYDPTESQRFGTNLVRIDTDADGLADAVEIFDGWVVAPCTQVPYFAQSSAVSADADMDGWTDGRERNVGSDPNNADTDNDGLIDSFPTEDFPVSCGKRIILTLVDWNVGSNDCWFDPIGIHRDGKFDYYLSIMRDGDLLRYWTGQNERLGSGDSVIFMSTISFALVPGQSFTLEGYIQDLMRTIANNDSKERWDVSEVFDYSSILPGERLITGPGGGCFSDDMITLQIDVIGG